MSKITEAMVDAAWQAFGDCPIDMCGDHDEEQKKCVVAAVEAALSAAQAQPDSLLSDFEAINGKLGPPAVPGIAELAAEYLAAIDADPVKDIWDTWDGKPKQGAEMTSSDQAWEEHGQNAARCLKRLRDALTEGRS